MQRISLDNENNSNSIPSSIEQTSPSSYSKHSNSTVSSTNSTASTKSIHSNSNTKSPSPSMSPTPSTSSSPTTASSHSSSKLIHPKTINANQTNDDIGDVDLVDGRIMKSPTATSMPPLGVNISEPIYAVVNLKNKYAQREKLKQMEENFQCERPNSFHVVSGDYEEVNSVLNIYGCVMICLCLMCTRDQLSNVTDVYFIFFTLQMHLNSSFLTYYIVPYSFVGYPVSC